MGGVSEDKPLELVGPDPCHMSDAGPGGKRYRLQGRPPGFLVMVGAHQGFFIDFDSDWVATRPLEPSGNNSQPAGAERSRGGVISAR